MNGMAKWVLAGLTFVGEIILWYGIGKAAFNGMVSTSNKTVATFSAIIVTVVVIILWSIFLAPKGGHRLSLLPRILAIVAMSIVTGFVLYKTGNAKLGLFIMIPMAIIQAIGQYLINGEL